MSRHLTVSLLVLVSTLVLILGCSGSDPVLPSADQAYPGFSRMNSAGEGYSRWLWGMWEVSVDLETGTITSIPMRSADLHFNILPLMNEGTPKVNLGFKNIAIDASNHRLQVDVSITHPFPALKQVPGFDVKGIFITKGEGYTLASSNAIMADSSEPRLVNADGYTRWWNPDEFTGEGFFGYHDGLYGTPDSVGDFKINLSGFKYFCDSLNPTDPIQEMDQNDRGVFRAGKKNTRRYLVDFGDQPGTFFKFNYAFDASWAAIPGYDPGDGPPDIPDDFRLTANCPEPYLFEITELLNTLSATTAGGTSGQIDFSVHIYDWQALAPLSGVMGEVSIVQVDIPQFGINASPLIPVPGSGAGSNLSTYMGSFVGSNPDKLTELDIVITATSAKGDYENIWTGFPTDDPLQAFFLYTPAVADVDVYSGWTLRYTKSLGPEFPNQGANPADLAVYKKFNEPRTAMVDQANIDYNNEGGHSPDSINEWADDYSSYSLPEHYHLSTGPLDNSGLWDDINRICVSDTSTRLFLTSTNHLDEYPDGDDDPLYSFLNWQTHTYLGNQTADAVGWVYFSNEAPRYWATDPSNGVATATDFIYSVFVYDTTGMGPGSPGVDPQRYIVLRWKPPYGANATDADWVRPMNVAPNGFDAGYVDRYVPWDHRLAVDDQTGGLPRFYILDSKMEIEVVDCDFNADEFTGWSAKGTITLTNLPVGSSRPVDIEVVQTKNMGEASNQVAALCLIPGNQWRVWVFQFDPAQPLGSQGVTQWMSPIYDGTPLALDALDDPVEVHVLHRSGGFTYVSVFRRYP